MTELVTVDGSQAALTARYSSALMNTFGAPKRVLVRGEGAYLWDADGNKYLDLLGGLAVNCLGHAHPFVVSAVTSQLATLGHVSNFFASAPQIALAEKLLGLFDAPGKVFFTNSGTEANEAAFKMTRRTGRSKIVSTLGAFHGRSMGALALTWKPGYREPFEPLPGDVEFVPYGDSAALAAAVDDETAAVILEPIQGESGVVDPPIPFCARRDVRHAARRRAPARLHRQRGSAPPARRGRPRERDRRRLQRPALSADGRARMRSDDHRGIAAWPERSVTMCQ